MPIEETSSDFLIPISQMSMAPEVDAVDRLLKNSALSATQIQDVARWLIEQTRAQTQAGILPHFLQTHQLATPQGITLMSLAESLLRIPDRVTASDLVADKIADNLFAHHLNAELQKLLASISLPVVRQGIALIGKQFVLAETIEAALTRAQKNSAYRYSFDMLGEGAKTAWDAQTYFANYVHAIHVVGKAAKQDPIHSPGISVKLSALHPRYQYTQIARLQKELVPKLIELASLAKQYQISLTIDAEEVDRLQLSLLLIEKVLASDELAHWDGLGLAVQAYQKAAPEVIDICVGLAKKYQRRLMVRLVKGAYWDSEIKAAQVQGLTQYPVYTRKVASDVSFLVCAQKLLANPAEIYPQFATHNAYSIAAILEMAGERRDFEFQRLQGMGEGLYTALMSRYNIAVRIYAPVGDYAHLLAYLVRRLLENGANASFVHQIEDPTIPVEQLIADPVAQLKAIEPKAHPKIVLPKDLYGDARKNSMGINFSDFNTQKQVFMQLSDLAHDANFKSAPINIQNTLQIAEQAFAAWAMHKIHFRAELLKNAADLFAAHQFELMHLLIQEGKKTIFAAQSEVREAIDYCRYYAMEAEKLLGAPMLLPGPAGERNELFLQGRGIAVCISPWNFPLAIFLGQIVAALVTGNTVIAKPASQTPKIAQYAVALLHQAGIPKTVLQLVIGKSSEIGYALIQDPRIALVVFTGSFVTAQQINRNLANREAPLATLIAETGGQNAMIVDSSALLEQVVTDVMTSAFDSAGQRCSALRILCVQDEIFDDCIKMLSGAMAELNVGSPSLFSTDVGPVIDVNAQAALQKHIDKMKKSAKLIYQTPQPQNLTGTFIMPVAFEIQSIDELTQEVFGPVLHVIRYQRKALPELLHALNHTGYGLTLGIHSRIEQLTQTIIHETFVGNNYINRNMIGAVVGVQPFGGQHLSGTGPKAGGPHYLARMVTEKTVSVNTAVMGNIELLGLQD